MIPKSLMKQARQQGLLKTVGGHEHWHAGLLLIIAGNGMSSPDATSRQRSRAAFEALIGVAERRGFVQSDDLRARIGRGDFGERTCMLARVAMDVPGEELNAALAEAGFNPHLSAGN